MIFTKPITELISARHSVRTYVPGRMPPDEVQQLRDYLAAVNGLGESRVRLRLVDSGESAEGARVGTYGVIRGADHYIVPVVPAGDSAALVQLGYRLEKAALFAVSLGLGTCWLGGTFTRGAFARLVDLQAFNILPAVMAVGVPAERPRLFDRLMHAVPGSGGRREWYELFFDGDASHALGRQQAGTFAGPLEMVRLAPSSMNTQPWRVIRDGNTFRFYGYSSGSPLPDVCRIDVGIAMCHFDLAAQEAGLSGEFSLEPTDEDYSLPHLTFISKWTGRQDG